MHRAPREPRRLRFISRWRAAPPLPSPAAPDVQSSAPATQISLSRVGVTGVEKVIRVDGGWRREPLPRRVRVLRRPQPAPGGRPHVALRGSRRRGDRRGRARRGVPRRGPRRPHRPARARAPGGPARRGLGDGALPGDRDDAGQRPADAGDLRPLRHRGRLAARDADADRRPGPGHDRLPLRAGDGRRPRPRTARRARLRRRADRARRSRRCPIATHNQRGIGSLHVGCPEGGPAWIDAPRAAADRRAVDELGDLRADEAARRAGGRRQGARAAALRRGLRAGDAAPRRRGLPGSAGRGVRDGAPGEPGDDPPPQRRSPSATASSTTCAPSWRAASTERRHTTMREWLEAPAT